MIHQVLQFVQIQYALETTELTRDEKKPRNRKNEMRSNATDIQRDNDCENNKRNSFVNVYNV